MHHQKRRLTRRAIHAALLAATLVGSLLGGAAEAADPPSPYPLGTVTVEAGGDPGSCPAGHTCERLRVVCPEVADRTAYVAIQARLAAPRGMAVFHSAGDGTQYWAEGGDRLQLQNDLRNQFGIESAQVRWDSGWMKSGDGLRAGPVRSACRPATVTQWVRDNLYAPPAVHPGTGRCGFCIVGSSGGSAAATYPITHFARESVVDGIFPTGGPTHAALTRGCLRRRGDEAYRYDANVQQKVDDSYGYLAGGGPCTTSDPSWAATWDRDGIDTQGNDYTFTTTRVHVITGALDTLQTAHASDFIERVETAGSLFVNTQVVAGMSHSLNTDGLAALKTALAADVSTPITACGNGLDDDRDGVTDTADLGCGSAADASERDPAGPQCDDGTDNDGDGRRDLGDGGCSSRSDTTEVDPAIACDDGIDNDSDGFVDYVRDLGCAAANGTSESALAGSPGAITVTTPSVTVAEKDPGQGTIRCSVGVSLSSSPSSDVTVTYASQPGTAAAGADFTSVNGTLKWLTGTTTLSKTVNVTILHDDVAESQEAFTVVLSNPTGGATLGSPSQATCTVNDDDAPVTGGPSITMGSPTYSVTEVDPGSTSRCRLTVKLSQSSATNVTVKFATSPGTATTADYTTKSGTLTFTPGQTSKSVSVTVTADTTDEPDEAFTVTLSNPTGGTLGSPSQATCTIRDDD